VCVHPGDTAQQVLRVMLDESIEHVPVIEGASHPPVLLGICTRTDLLKVRRDQFAAEQAESGLVARAVNHHRFEGLLRRRERVDASA
jgi:hypothetical protein